MRAEGVSQAQKMDQIEVQLLQLGAGVVVREQAARGAGLLRCSPSVALAACSVVSSLAGSVS